MMTKNSYSLDYLFATLVVSDHLVRLFHVALPNLAIRQQSFESVHRIQLSDAVP